ncbi:DKNYY domain-containing protein [Shewanella sp. SG41-4]|uniref:DKNYY domain-containing protein n=1 Tax=Shewanella sp. SG41-4 TaxID=2760976 RepID=UPI0015FED418|nr:DKNYY domain-containing protein [Shewanella sp. SG41-4]MBB1440920.1 DKNYY domain-containing protein [Shewanella sp. SG41-4]
MKLPFITLVLLCCSCSTHYQINSNSVDHVSWNEGQGKVVQHVNGADPKTFQELLPFYGKDQNGVFWGSSIIEGADSATFVAIDNYYGVDAYHGIVKGNVILESDGASFEYLGNNWSRDFSSYFYNGERLDLCDYDTFKIIKSLLSDRARDNKCLYDKSKTVPIKDAESLVVLPANYAKDRFHVYWAASIINGADPLTFVVKDKRSLSIAKDKNACYSGAQILSCIDLNDDGQKFCGCNQ